ncbi:MAG: hypothetical protein AAF483_02875 [Planctomycetota bacterium]
MLHQRLSLLVVCFLFLTATRFLHAQQEIGYAEQFALAEDRREALKELIPETPDYFYYHCLHFQNEGQFAEAQAIINAWRNKLGDTQQSRQMQLRQSLLTYEQNPKGTVDYLKSKFGINFYHAPPSKDRAAQLKTSLNNSAFDFETRVRNLLARDATLAQVEEDALVQLLDRKLTTRQLRDLLGRLRRADVPGVVKRVAEELAFKDSKGFGWARIHNQLTLQQLGQLLELRSNLVENGKFIRAYSARLAPRAGVSLADRKELRNYLDRLVNWSDRLPASQNSFKALIFGNLLRLNLAEGKYDQELFLKYLALPRAAAYYNQKLLQNRARLTQLSFSMPEVTLPAIGNDSVLVRRHLEHFLKSANNVDIFARWLDRDYLEQVLAETKILYGVGENRSWYAKLSPTEQRNLRDRIEIRFATYNSTHYRAGDEVNLDVELKNVDELLVRVYEINTAAYLRNNSKQIDTDIDLDGLVANEQRVLKFAQPAELRHMEKLQFPKMKGRGVWVVDLLGGGRRSRALIRKGELIAVERLGDAGHVLQILDETGAAVEGAYVEFGGRQYGADSGEILIPFAEKSITRQLLLVDGDYASRHVLAHRSESYNLQAGFLLDRQSLVAGTKAKVAIHPRLTCNGTPISVRLLESPTLTISATDADGIETSQVIANLEPSDEDELVHQFLVPQRLKSIKFALSGKIYNQSKNVHQDISVARGISCNAIQTTAQIADFFLQHNDKGFRLLVLGRNGEPIARLPVTLSFKNRNFKGLTSYTLATDADGVVKLGELSDISNFNVTAQGIRQASFAPSKFHRDWPALQLAESGKSLQFPLGKDTASKKSFSLTEIRNNQAYADKSPAIQIQPGVLNLDGLEAGDYVLRDHEAGQTMTIRIEQGTNFANYVVGSSRVLQRGSNTPVFIRNAAIEDGSLEVEIENADFATRLHVLADSFYPESQAGQDLHMPTSPLMSRSRKPLESFYIDSLRLDEEYSYILNRKNSKKYPGNLLPQPTLLIHPWEISTTENNRNDAKKGEQFGGRANDAPMAAAPDAEAESRRQRPITGWKSYDFLEEGSQLLANVEVKDGKVSIPLEDLTGFSSISLVVVHPNSSDSRRLALPVSKLVVRDMRLRKSFDADVHLAQAQKVQFLKAGEKQSLGDPKTRRLETYTTIGDVFQLYATMLNDGQWEKFRFVAKWPKLTVEEKESRYNEMACHELNFFLYMKDRKFFDRVVKPQIRQKLDQQLVDQWLLGESVESYTELWRTQRLNTLERILIAKQIADSQEGTRRWISDSVTANPVPLDVLKSRFSIALSRSQLNFDSGIEGESIMLGGVARGRGGRGQATGGVDAFGLAGGGFGGGGGGRGLSSAEKMNRRLKSSNSPAAPGSMAGEEAEADFADGLFGADSDSDKRFYKRDRLRADSGGAPAFFQSLDATKEWAETQFYRIRLKSQTPSLIRPNSFWEQYLKVGSDNFLPNNLDTPISNLNEALCALAVIDLPFTAEAPQISIEGDELFVESKTPAVIFLESIEASTEVEEASILVGQDIYLAQPNTAQRNNRPVQSQPLLVGIPYRTSIVVTNPSNERQRVQVLAQLPQGAIPLAGSKVTRSTAVDIEPYSTKQIQYQFYFPMSGEFDHYGAQISREQSHITAGDSSKLRVLAEPASVDEETWTYVADWGSNEAVLAFLDKANLQQIDLNRIAFRMSDKAFYTATTQKLSATGNYNMALWAYSLKHQDAPGIGQYLHNRRDITSQLGAAFDSSIIQIDPSQQMSYEHLDYKPLVVARAHQLGTKKKILNPSMFNQYQRLLDVIAHGRAVTNDQKMQLCYYLILQNRIEEALSWFEGLNANELKSQIQYVYLDAYLDFFRGNYERAAELAQQYVDYPVPRWRNLFQQVATQVDDRIALMGGTGAETLVSTTDDSDEDQRLLTDGRSQKQTNEARQTPTLDLTNENDRIKVDYTNLGQFQVNFYQMDIELLFSRKPFVSQDEGASPVIKPNFTQTIELDNQTGSYAVSLPKDLQNKNVLVEVISEGIARSSVVTANSLKVDVAVPFGQIQVMSEKGRAPVEGAYVKVYARHRDGSIRFFKDGYTDLRGRFDYATLSTSDLNTTKRFAILVLDDELGAVVREANPPVR